MRVPWLKWSRLRSTTQRLVKSVPPPRIKSSQERRNLAERLSRFNTDTKVSYIYLVDFGKIMAFHTVKGKVSSVNSLLTTPDQIVTIGNTLGNLKRSRHVVQSPDLDGSYGSNGAAVFWFTTDGTYVEWNGTYMLSDKPLVLTQKPALVVNMTEEEYEGVTETVEGD